MLCRLTKHSLLLIQMKGTKMLMVSKSIHSAMKAALAKQKAKVDKETKKLKEMEASFKQVKPIKR